MKRKYKGYAQSIGFDPIQAPDTTRRMAEADNRMIRGMEAQRDAIRQNREAVSQGLSRKNQLEAENRDQNYRFNKQNRQIIQDAELRNRQVLIDNANREAAAQVNQLKPLAEFSESLSKVILGYQEAASEQAYMEAFNQGMMEDFPFETVAQRQQIEGALTAQDEQIQRVADGLASRGAGPEIVFGVRSIGRSKELGLMKARVIRAGGIYGDWLDEQYLTNDQTQVQVGDKVLTPMTAVTPEDRAAVRQALREEFLKQTGLFGIKPVMLQEAIVQMREAEQRMAARDRQTYAKTESDRMFQAAESEFEATLTVDPGTAVNNWLRTTARTLGPDGRNPLGPRAALDMLKQKLLNAPRGTVTEETIAAIEATAPFNQPTTTYGKQFPWFFSELREDLRNETFKEFQQQEAEKGMEQKQLLDQLRERLSKERVPVETLKEYAQNWFTRFGTRPPELMEIIDQYGIIPGLNMTTSDLIKEFDKAAEDKTLTIYDVDRPGVPLEIKQKYMRIAEDIRKITEADPASKETKDAIKRGLERKLGPLRDVFGNVQSISLDFAVNAAFAEYQSTYRQLLAGATDPDKVAAAQQKARASILSQIESNSPISPYYFPDKPVLGKDKPEFEYFYRQLTNASGVSQGLSMSQEHVKKTLEIVNKGGEATLDSHALIPVKILQAAQESYGTNKFVMPALALAIAQELDGRVSPYEILNRQLKARGLPEIVAPTAAQAAFQLSPEMQRILNFENSYLRSRRATLSSGDYSPFLRLIDSKESGAYGGYDAMNTEGRAGGTVAIGSANSRNVFGRGLSQMTIGEVMQLQAQGKLHAAGRFQITGPTLSDLMTTNVYGAPQFKPTDKFDQATQDAMAIQLAQFRLKRGGANPVKLREEFRNLWVGFEKVSDAELDAAIASLRQPNLSPYRRADFMSPRLVYHIGNLGYDSKGSHLDVKPVKPGSVYNDRNQAITKTELDKYVSVKKGDKLIPISMGTITTDDDRAHRARGSHGHDFAAPEGTGVYIKNGARVVDHWVDNSKRGQGSHRIVIELPDGRRYAFIHGTAPKGVTNS